MGSLDEGGMTTANAAEAETRDQDGRAMTADRSRHAASARVALLLGFAAVFALWLVWGTQLVQNLRHIEHNVESLQRHYVRGEQALSRVRTNELLGSI